MKTVLTSIFTLLLLQVFAQQSRPVEFGLGFTSSLVWSDSVNEQMAQPNSVYADYQLKHGFGLDILLKFRPLDYLKIGVAGSIDRASVSGPAEYTSLSAWPVEDILYATGHVKTQLSSYSYGLTSDFIYSKLFFPEIEKSELFLNAGLFRSHVFLKDRIYNPFLHHEFYNFNHLGVSWTFQLGLGYNYVIKKNDFIQTIGVQLTYRGLRNSSLQSRIYGSEYEEWQDPNITAGLQSLGLRVSLGLAK